MQKRHVIGQVNFFKVCEFLKTLQQPLVGTNRQIADVVRKTIGLDVSESTIASAINAAQLERKDPRSGNFGGSDRIVRLAVIVNEIVNELKTQAGLEVNQDLLHRIKALIDRKAE